MAIVLITGGVRSGKSRFALEHALSEQGSKVFIATAEPIDSDFRTRIERHQCERGPEWDLREAPRQLEREITKSSEADLVLIDCITVWLGNLFYEAEKNAERFSEEDASERIQHVIEASRQVNSRIMFVSNEVGLGVHPASEMGRRFADAQGRVNQLLAASADEVYFVVSGIPLRVK